MKIAEFAQKHQLKLESVKLLGRNGSDPKWQATHYQCRLSSVGRGNPPFSYSSIPRDSATLMAIIARFPRSLRNAWILFAPMFWTSPTGKPLRGGRITSVTIRVRGKSVAIYTTIQEQHNECVPCSAQETFAEFLSCEGE